MFVHVQAGPGRLQAGVLTPRRLCSVCGGSRLFCQTPQHELVEPPGIHTSTTSLAIASAVVRGRRPTSFIVRSL